MTQEGNLAVFESKKGAKSPKTREAMPTIIGLHAFHINLYLHEIFEPIPLFDTHGL